MSDRELLPCPFCGHVGLEFSEGSTFRWLVATCEGCGATAGETRIQTLGQGTKNEWMEAAQADAIAAWNRRAEIGKAAMSDLTDRLRKAARTGLDPSPFDTLAHEAADEIERLRAEVERLTKIIDDLWGEA